MSQSDTPIYTEDGEWVRREDYCQRERELDHVRSENDLVEKENDELRSALAAERERSEELYRAAVKNGCTFTLDDKRRLLSFTNTERERGQAALANG